MARATHTALSVQRSRTCPPASRSSAACAMRRSVSALTSTLPRELAAACAKATAASKDPRLRLSVAISSPLPSAGQSAEWRVCRRLTWLTYCNFSICFDRPDVGRPSDSHCTASFTSSRQTLSWTDMAVCVRRREVLRDGACCAPDTLRLDDRLGWRRVLV